MMEFGLREVLILVGLVVIGGILFDGYRRMRRAKLGSLHLGNEIGGSAEETWEFYKGELPNGGARTVRLGKFHAGPSDSRPAPIRQEPELGEAFGSALDDPEPAPSETVAAPVSQSRPITQPKPQHQQPEREPVSEPGTDAHSQSDLFTDDAILLAAREEQRTKLNKATRKDRHSSFGAPREEEAELPKPDFSEVLVINVMAREGDIAGADLLRVLLSCGFRFGDMNIFHRYEQHSGKGAKLFSVANVVEPGVFDLNKMDQFSTPGICMFMKLPGPKRPMHSFEILMDSARKIANLLDADVKDEHHNILRQQTAEHYRQRVLDFERKLMTFQAGQRQH